MGNIFNFCADRKKAYQFPKYTLSIVIQRRFHQTCFGLEKRREVYSASCFRFPGVCARMLLGDDRFLLVLVGNIMVCVNVHVDCGTEKNLQFCNTA